MESIIPKGTIPPLGHYSPGIIHNGLIYVSGQLPIDPTNGNKVYGEIEIQTKQVLANLKRILISGGSSIDKVLKVTIYVTDVELWGRINTVYAEFFGEHKPARAVVPVPTLHYDFLLELEAIAAV